jgi:hypothetical protein
MVEELKTKKAYDIPEVTFPIPAPDETVDINKKGVRQNQLTP